MTDTIESILTELGDAFRGLWIWQNQVAAQNVRKWSATIQVGENILDTTLTETALEALQAARETLNANS